LKTGAAFTFTAYEFGDNFANGTGKIVSVPLTLTYRKALSRTIIFTSTTLFDLNKIDKDYLKMPNVVSEDTATWWKILRNGYTAYGMNVVTTIYRRPAGSLSSNKIKAIKRIWYLYRKVEKLSIFSSTYNFLFWAVRATKRRLV
ncbi:MAG: glycosyltransferase family 2 protein, partial [Lachnospiraceae bacterium]|nr:glycosyltransferase family 2 protein [Lachnospiraceae bacterium]